MMMMTTMMMMMMTTMIDDDDDEDDGDDEDDNGGYLLSYLSTRAVINDSIDAGSQIPLIQEASRNGYAVLCLNQNQTFLEVDGFRVKIRVRVTDAYGAFVRMGYLKVVTQG